MPIVLIHNCTLSITTGFPFSPRKLSSGSIDFAVIAYPSPVSRRLFLQADEIFNCGILLNSFFQEEPFLFSFNGNKIASNIFAKFPAFFPITVLRRVFMKCVTWITKDKVRACSSYNCNRMKSEIALTTIMVGLLVNFSWTLFKREGDKGYQR